MDYRYIQADREETIETAKRFVVDTIWKIANIELVRGITFPETQEIFDGRVPNNVDVNTVLVVNDLKHAWQFLFENIDYPLSLELLSEYNHLIKGSSSKDAGKIRSLPARVTGTTFIPPIPSYESVKNQLENMKLIENPVDRALEAFSLISRGQWFMDGNKRTAQMVANHILIQANAGVLSIPVELKAKFFEKLLEYYESADSAPLKNYLYETSIGMIPSGLPMPLLEQLEEK